MIFNCLYCRHGVMVITTAKLHLSKLELRLCAGSNPAPGVSEICDGEDFWQLSRLKIRLNNFRRSTIPQKQFIFIIIIIIFVCTSRITVALLKWSSDRLEIAAKGFLKLSNLFVLIKLKRLLLPKHFAYVTFGKLLRVFSTKVNQLYLLYIMTLRCFFLHVMFSKNVCWEI